VVIWALGYFPRNVSYTRDYDAEIAREQERMETAGDRAGVQAENKELRENLGIQEDNGLHEARERILELERAKEAERQAHSLIGRLGVAMEPLIAPLGFDWKMGIALLTGFAAKEIVVSTMGVLYQANNDAAPGTSTSLVSRIRAQVYTSGQRAGQPVFTPPVGLSFLVFALLYLPCMAVIATVGRESGSWKWAGFVLLYTTVIAWVASFAVFQLGTLLHM
jgi:ferrous iron transport protein B